MLESEKKSEFCGVEDRRLPLPPRFDSFESLKSYFARWFPPRFIEDVLRRETALFVVREGSKLEEVREQLVRRLDAKLESLAQQLDGNDAAIAEAKSEERLETAGRVASPKEQE